MIKLLITYMVILYLSVSFCYAQTGITENFNTNPIPVQDQNVSLQISDYSKTSPSLIQKVLSNETSDDEGFDIHIPPLESLILRYDPESKQVEQFRFNRYILLTKKAMSAIEVAPSWLKNDLIDLFSQLSWEYQHKWANCILDAEAPYVDEIAFSISALSPEYLKSEHAYREMIEQNARLIYHFDSLLKYVRIVEHGDPSAGGNYYSTTAYIQKDNYGNEYEVEIPKDIYYWYIVHPKLTDEIPGFVDPYKIESSVDIGLTAPEQGKFWRDYIVNHHSTDIPNEDFGLYDDYVKNNASISARKYISDQHITDLVQHMVDSLSTIQVYWDGELMSGQSMSYKKNHAMALLNRYMQSIMHFWSTSQERPHQPVRIIHWGVGRCGEHQDLALAIARTALIPCCGIMAHSSDHVWNGIYYNGRWAGWEPFMGFVDRGYYDEDNNRWGSVNISRSDGVSEADVVEDYSGQSGTIRIKVLDKYQLPIDGAKVILFAKARDTSLIYYDNYRITDYSGQVEFVVGEGRVYYATVYALDEKKPSGNYVAQVTDNKEVVADKIYEATFRMTLTILEQTDATEIEDTRTKDADTKLYLNLNVEDEYLFGATVYDDLGSIQTREHKRNQATFDFFELNENNFQNYYNGQEISAFNLKEGLTKWDSTIALPSNEYAYFFIQNKETINRLHIGGNIALISGTDTTTIEIGLGDQSLIPTTIATNEVQNDIKIYPNPAIDHCFLELNSVEDKNPEIFLTNSLGQSFGKDHINKINSTLYRISLNGFAKGIYFINIINSKGKQTLPLLIFN